jgi:hypothetical protein
MKNITYLFGAGASANALPVVKIFNERLEKFQEYLKVNKRKFSSSDLETFMDDLKIILEESKKHSTIDTVAKKFFHLYSSHKEDLQKLKRVLTVYLVYEQVTEKIYQNPSFKEELSEFYRTKKGKVDSRYDAFIASILRPRENEFLFPDNVNILTWNYDCQFELAFKEFCNENMCNIQSRLNVFPFLTSISHPDHWNKLNNQQFKILHLNGQGHSYLKKDEKYISTLDSTKVTESHIEDALKCDHNNITFSWERFSNNSIQYGEMKEVIDAADKITTNTKILVIVGYSFPFFNRDIDKKLLFKKTFEKIYVQDTNAENLIDVVKNSFEPSVDNKNIIPVKNTDQFFLPPELN